MELDEHSDDILSAALSEAGLHEFFDEPSTSSNVSSSQQSPVVVVSDEPTTTTATSTTVSTTTELASPATASTGSSPDLPIDGEHKSQAINIGPPTLEPILPIKSKTTTTIVDSPPKPLPSMSSAEMAVMRHNYAKPRQPPPPTFPTTTKRYVRFPSNQPMPPTVVRPRMPPPLALNLSVVNEEIVSSTTKLPAVTKPSFRPPQNSLLPTTSASASTSFVSTTTSNVVKFDEPSTSGGPSSISLTEASKKSDSKSYIAQNDPSAPDDSNVGVEDADDEEGLGHAETYSDYTPSKLRSGLQHPDPVVETSSLSSVTPPDVSYHISIPEHIVDTGKLSALQLEAIIYACQQHDTFNPNGERVGYLVGDGAGVGKGRTIAGLIYENYLLGRKRALWFSVSSDLKYDAERDLADIGAERIKVHALNKFKYSKISGKENGVKKGVIFATYSSLIGESNNAKSKYRTRLKQLIHWCGGRDFEGVIVFDECHRAKNLVPTGSSKPTKTGQTVLELQKELPKARVVYASATGATETRNMAYMTRLGLWGPGKPFKDFNDFISAVEKRGVGAMEIVAMDMKQRGLYLARQLSFAGTSFRIEEVPLSKEFIHIYDESVKLWLEARKQFQLASEFVDIERNERKSMWGQFWAAHQRFFKYICIAAKVSSCVRMAREAVKNGKCVVIGLQSTGEARTLEQLEECGGELNDFVSTAKSVFMSLVEKHFPMSDGKKDSARRNNYSLKDAKKSLLNDIDNIFGDEKRRTASVKRKIIDRNNVVGKRKKIEENNEIHEILSSDDESSEEEKLSNDDEKNSTNSDSDGDEKSTNSEDNLSETASSGDDSNSEEDDNEHFNPFADEEEEEDPWEIKRQKAKRKKSKKRNKPTKEDLEEVDELGKQLEEAMEEDSRRADEKIQQKQSQVNESSVDVNEFLHSSSSFFDPTFDRRDRMGDNFGLSQANLMKAELLAAIERLGEFLPPNTLDQLINELGGPEYVAEMTGRKGRVVSRDDGEIQYELRHEGDVPLELLNLAEKERFMSGQKHIAIISEAASSGISLQSDRRAKNQRRRVHITLELPWSADKAIQQFGRTHRSNQINAPEYVFLISELAGEHRFASIVAKRLESLGALTHGDRRATESRDLSQFNLDTKYGRAALELTLKSILDQAIPIVKPPVSYKGEFFRDMKQYMEGVGLALRESETSSFYILEKDVNMSKFLNRILGLPVYAQNALFEYFSNTLKAVVDEAKRDGRYDMGIMDLGSGREQVKKVETRIFIGKFDAGGFRTELHLVSVERGLSWEEAKELYAEHGGSDDGFYISTNPNVKTTAVLLCAVGRRRLETNERLYNVFRPNTGLNPNMETLNELLLRYKRASQNIAESIWKSQYDISAARCQHVFWYGKCRNEQAGLTCEIGKRKRSYYILSGSVLSVWNTVEHVLSGFFPGGGVRRQGRMQVVRVRTEKGQKIVGILIPNTHVRAVVERLAEESSRSYLETFS